MFIIKENRCKKRAQHRSDYKLKVTYADNGVTLEDIMNTKEFKDWVRKIIFEYK